MPGTRSSWPPMASAGYELIVREKPDMVLADILLPRMHGIALCEKIRASDEFRHIPIILMTGVYKDVNLRMYVHKGLADDFIEKPFREKDLLAKIEHFIGCGEEKVIAQPAAQAVPDPAPDIRKNQAAIRWRATWMTWLPGRTARGRSNRVQGIGDRVQGKKSKKGTIFLRLITHHALRITDCLHLRLGHWLIGAWCLFGIWCLDFGAFLHRLPSTLNRKPSSISRKPVDYVFPWDGWSPPWTMSRPCAMTPASRLAQSSAPRSDPGKLTMTVFPFMPL